MLNICEVVVNTCEDPELLRVIYFIKILIDIVKYAIPIILIILVIVECAKGVINENNKLGDMVKRSSNKILSAILVFAVPTIINITFDLIDEINGKEIDYIKCWTNATAEKIEELDKTNEE